MLPPMSAALPLPRLPVPAGQALLGSDRRACAAPPPTAVVQLDRAPRGAVCAAGSATLVRRAHRGSAGPLVLEAGPDGDGLRLQVWGPPGTPPHEVDSALDALAAWVGAHDHADGFSEVVADHPLLARLQRDLGTPRLSRLPSVGEALGRAILAQLVQTVEARRSTAQLVASAGTPAPHGLWCWPTPAQLGSKPAWELRRCGISLRAARSLHAGALADGRLREVQHDRARLDQRLRALPGVGVWTSAETRLALGDPDAVSVGDYNLPSVVGHVLGDGPTDDAGMLELLAPFAGQRGRVIRLVVAALAARRVPPLRRRAPRAALSAHRYW
jgi:3-methyladenine DNA glycosylase/8-oxoguanine DNA glycosylase